MFTIFNQPSSSQPMNLVPRKEEQLPEDFMQTTMTSFAKSIGNLFMGGNVFQISRQQPKPNNITVCGPSFRIQASQKIFQDSFKTSI